MNNRFSSHASAFVDDGALIGENTKIWHNVHITQTAVIGKNSSIGQNCYIAGKMGDGCRIQNNVNLYLGVELGNYVFCGPSMSFTNDLNPRAKYSKNGQYVKTIISDGVSLGALSVVVCGTRIGKCAMIGAGSVVTKDVPDFALVYGNPARQHGWVCECGEKLPSDFESAVCASCKRQYQKNKESVSLKVG